MSTDPIQPDDYGESPWQKKEVMEQLYLEERRSGKEIAEGLGCAYSTVHKWLRRHDIPTRSRSEAISEGYGYSPYEVFLYNHTRGYEIWENGGKAVPVHRLLAVAKYGFDAVCGMDVHHRNGVTWDNRPDNIELQAPEAHQRQHLKIDGVDRMRVAEMYEHGDIASRPLAEMFDVSSATVLKIHEEFYES